MKITYSLILGRLTKITFFAILPDFHLFYPFLQYFANFGGFQNVTFDKELPKEPTFLTKRNTAEEL